MKNEPELHEPQPLFQGLGRPLYPMRLLGTAVCIIISWTYVYNFGGARLWYLFLLALALIYPHVFRKLSAGTESRQKIELGASLVDAFILGSTVYVVGFSAIPALSLLTIALSNGMALGSLPFMSLTAVSLMIGMFSPAFFYGVNYLPQEHLLMDMFSAFFLLFYFILFAWVAYKRSILLKESRQELVQQKLALEIEKKNRTVCSGRSCRSPLPKRLKPQGISISRVNVRNSHSWLPMSISFINVSIHPVRWIPLRS